MMRYLDAVWNEHERPWVGMNKECVVIQYSVNVMNQVNKTFIHAIFTNTAQNNAYNNAYIAPLIQRVSDIWHNSIIYWACPGS